MRFDSLQSWLAWQESCHPKEIDLGLDRVRAVAQRMDLMTPAATVITVAGTNGKGSCVASLEALLAARGESVGAYTSPHLLHYNERIRIGGEPAGDTAICAAFAAIDEARGDISLSYFEFGTLAALWLFREQELDYWLLEVGLGGRLDATNILDADVAVITSVDLDHQQWLGHNRELIGREKAGICRPGRPLVCADPQVPESVTQHAEDLGTPVWLARRDFSWHDRKEGWHLEVDTPQARLSWNLPRPRLPQASVAAAFQALALVERLPEVDRLADCLRQLSLPGRLQHTTAAGVPVLLDVAHNPAAARLLAERLAAESSDRGRLDALFAVMADKDIRACLQPLVPLVHHWWLATLPDTPRAATPEQVAGLLYELGVPEARVTLGMAVADRLSHWLADRDSRSARDALLVTGSFYTVAAALEKL